MKRSSLPASRAALPAGACPSAAVDEEILPASRPNIRNRRKPL